MTEEFVRKALATSVAQICSNIGWHTMSNSTLQMMTDILYEYFKDMARSVKKFSEISDSLTPDIDDVKMAFQDKDVALPDLIKYLKQVGSIEFPHQVPKFPIPTKSNLNIMKPGSREIVTRPVYVHEHLPTMFPEKSDKESQNESCSNQTANSSTPLNIFDETLHFKETQTSKNDRSNKDKIVTHRQLREISSVVMTSSGFLSPSREGKLPESRLMPISNLKASCSPLVDQLPSPKLPKEVKDLTLNKQPLQKIPDCVKEKEKSVVEISNVNLNANNSIKKKELTKVKKLTHSKVTPKLKPFKKAVINELINQEKHCKKPPKIKNKSKLNLLNTIFDKPAQAKHPKKTSGEKLTTEPNKQKLNIFKKISKIKEDKYNELYANTSLKSSVSNILKQNSTCTVVSSNISVKPEIVPEVIEEKPFKPVFFKPVEKIPDCKSPKNNEPIIEELNSEVNQKRKKKQKLSTNDLKTTSLLDDTSNTGTKKSKIKHDPEIYSKFSFFGPLTPGFLQPGTSLLPPSLASNPLVPKYTAPNRVLPILDKTSPINSMMYLPLQEEDGVDKSKVDKLSPSINVEKEKVPAEKIKAKKGHKKIKKEKIKSKKKKDKKDKSKDKSKSERKKEKLLKKKKILAIEELITCKQEPVDLEDKEEPALIEDTLIPKIKLKLTGSTSSTDSTPVQRKIVIKPVVKNKSSESEGDLHHIPKETASDIPVEPIKSSITSKSKTQPNEKSSTPTIPTLLTPIKQEDTVVVLNPKPSRPSSKTPVVDVHTPATTSETTLPLATDSTQVILDNKQKTKPPKKIKKTQSSQPNPAFYFDESGNQVWICPTCTKKDDGSPMIGCDGCDAWYHWVCVGIQCPPDCAVWYCPKCLTKRAERGGSAVSAEKAKRGRPLKKKISIIKN